jgi:hypothetical protein
MVTPYLSVRSGDLLNLRLAHSAKKDEAAPSPDKPTPVYASKRKASRLFI